MSRFLIPSRFANDPELVALRRQMLIDEIDRTLSLAEIRSLPFEELLNGIEHLPTVSNSAEIVLRACEYEYSPNQAYSLAESVRRLAETVDRLPGRRKPTYDRAIMRILSRLPADVAWPVVDPWLDHKRKFRREAAYAVLRRTGVDGRVGSRLLEVFENTGDQTALELIARNPPSTSTLDVNLVLPLFDDEYWRMRLVEAVLIDNEPKALALASDFPREFTHAVGRQKQKRLLPELKKLFTQQPENLDFLSIYAWTLGQVGALDEIGSLRAHIERMKSLT